MQRRSVIRLSTIALAAALAAGPAGCSTGSSSDSVSQSGSGGSARDGGVVAPEAASGDSTGIVADNSRSVISSGSVTLTTNDPSKTADKATSITEAAGGRVDSISVQPKSEYQSASAQLTLRIPAEKLTPTLDDLKALGEVTDVSISASDVTSQVTDVDARVKSLTASVERLRTLLASSASTTDLIAIESALSAREADLESFTAQQKALADQVDYATISLQLYSPDAVADAPPGDFWSGLVAGWTTLVAALAGLLVVLGAVIPWIIFLGVIAFIVIVIVRTVRRRRPRRASATTSPDPAVPATESVD